MVGSELVTTVDFLVVLGSEVEIEFVVAVDFIDVVGTEFGVAVDEIVVVGSNFNVFVDEIVVVGSETVEVFIRVAAEVVIDIVDVLLVLASGLCTVIEVDDFVLLF